METQDCLDQRRKGIGITVNARQGVGRGVCRTGDVLDCKIVLRQFSGPASLLRCQVGLRLDETKRNIIRICGHLGHFQKIMSLTKGRIKGKKLAFVNRITFLGFVESLSDMHAIKRKAFVSSYCERVAPIATLDASRCR